MVFSKRVLPRQVGASANATKPTAKRSAFIKAIVTSFERCIYPESAKALVPRSRTRSGRKYIHETLRAARGRCVTRRRRTELHVRRLRVSCKRAKYCAAGK